MDSNILIAYYSEDQLERAKRELVVRALEVFAQLKTVELWTSMWAITEMVNILVSGHKMDPGKVADMESQLLSERRLEGLRIYFAKASPLEDYDFNEFFYHVRQGILRYHSGVGDVIHSVIIKNNKITQILTLDEKKDFKQILGLTVLHPRDIKFKKQPRAVR